MKTSLYVEALGKQTDTKQLTDLCKEIWKSEGNLVKDITNIELFFKPEESSCYYVINEESKGCFQVE